MDTKYPKKKPLILFVLWIILALVLTAFNKYNQYSNIPVQGNASVIITIVASVLFFLPLLLVIYHQAKASSLKWLSVAAKRLLVYTGCVVIIFAFLLLFS